jgi:pimeloyl-ACP methyl ester carboxylesterase
MAESRGARSKTPPTPLAGRSRLFPECDVRCPSLEGDVAATRQVIDAQDVPVVLVGHSYGGAVITEAGTDPNVAALVYIAAFAPDAGESVNTLIADPPPGAPVPPILPPKDGFLSLDRARLPSAGGSPNPPGGSS